VIISAAARQLYNPVRAQVFTFFFFALSLYVLERARLSGEWWPLLLLPVVQILWCNLHGGFPAGLGLIALYAAGEFIARRPYRPFLLVLLFSGLVTLINPYGVTYWEYMARAVTMPRPYITEWVSVFRAYQTGLTNFAMIIYLVVLVSAGLLGMWQSGWREVTASLALAVTLYLGLKHIRHLVFLWILAAAYLPVLYNVNVKFFQSRPGLTKLWHLKGTKIVFLAFLAILSLSNLFTFIDRNPFSLQLPGQPASQEDIYGMFYPVGAVNFVKKQGLSGKILTNFKWGEYLIWELYPQSLVAFDGRYETVYPQEVEDKFAAFINALPQWRDFLKDYPPDLILLDRRMEVAGLIRKEPHWRQIYQDASCVLFAADKQ
jgi:hypothetical protein